MHTWHMDDVLGRKSPAGNRLRASTAQQLRPERQVAPLGMALYILTSAAVEGHESPQGPG